MWRPFAFSSSTRWSFAVVARIDDETPIMHAHNKQTKKTQRASLASPHASVVRHPSSVAPKKHREKDVESMLKVSRGSAVHEATATGPVWWRNFLCRRVEVSWRNAYDLRIMHRDHRRRARTRRGTGRKECALPRKWITIAIQQSTTPQLDAMHAAMTMSRASAMASMTTTTTARTGATGRGVRRAMRIARCANASATPMGDDDVVDRAGASMLSRTTRRACVTFLGAMAANVVAANESRAEVVPEFLDETLEIIKYCRSIMRGETTDDATLDEFQTKRRAWFAKYQYKHGKSFYGYANTWNAQAKIGVQIAVNRENGEAYDADHTVYNREYLLKILDKAEEELNDMAKRNAF